MPCLRAVFATGAVRHWHGNPAEVEQATSDPKPHWLDSSLRALGNPRVVRPSRRFFYIYRGRKGVQFESWTAQG